jgi:hypothetical protein
MSAAQLAQVVEYSKELVILSEELQLNRSRPQQPASSLSHLVDVVVHAICECNPHA